MEATNRNFVEEQWDFKHASLLCPTVYDTESQADIHGITYGQRIIDEQVPGLKAG
jgi:hypothetical protein